MACLATDEETGEDVVDYDAWAAITERHPFHAFGANLSNYLSELARTLPPPLLDQVRQPLPRPCCDGHSERPLMRRRR